MFPRGERRRRRKLSEKGFRDDDVDDVRGDGPKLNFYHFHSRIICRERASQPCSTSSEPSRFLHFFLISQSLTIKIRRMFEQSAKVQSVVLMSDFFKGLWMLKNLSKRCYDFGLQLHLITGRWREWMTFCVAEEFRRWTNERLLFANGNYYRKSIRWISRAPFEEANESSYIGIELKSRIIP